MNLNLDLIREIVFQMEKMNCDDKKQSLAVDGHSSREIGQHCEWMYGAGLFEGSETTFIGSKPRIGFGGLTAKGYQFLATIRSDVVWRRIKTKVTEKSLPLEIDAILRYGVPFAAAAFSVVVKPSPRIVE